MSDISKKSEYFSVKELTDNYEKVYGPIEMLKTIMTVVNRVLVKSNVISEAELKRLFVEEIGDRIMADRKEHE